MYTLMHVYVYYICRCVLMFSIVYIAYTHSSCRSLVCCCCCCQPVGTIVRQKAHEYFPNIEERDENGEKSTRGVFDRKTRKSITRIHVRESDSSAH